MADHQQRSCCWYPYCCYDGNGNVVGLVSAGTGTETACYEYGPFAEPIHVSGPAARTNPFRFSTKRTDDTTDVVLYEYRAYSSSFGRWLSRDLLEEAGGFGVYTLAINTPNHFCDPYGLFMLVPRPFPPPPITMPRPVPVPMPTPVPRPHPHPPIPLPPEWPPYDKDRWLCHTKCNVQQIDPNVCCPKYVEGWAEAETKEAARRESLRAATQSCPRGGAIHDIVKQNVLGDDQHKATGFMKKKQLCRVDIESEVIKVVDLSPIPIPCGNGDDIRLRIELLRTLNPPFRIFARIWRKEFYRVRPTFPQKAGKPAEGLCDELILVEDTYFVPYPNHLSGKNAMQALRKVISVIESKLGYAQRPSGSVKRK